MLPCLQRLERDVAVLLLEAGPLLGAQGLEVLAQAAASVLGVDDRIHEAALRRALQARVADNATGKARESGGATCPLPYSQHAY